MSKREYEMAFRLNAKLGNSYGSVFSKAGNIAAKTFNKISSAASSVLGSALGGFNFSDISDIYKEFQQSMANTGAIAGVSKMSSEFRQLEEAALEAGRTTSKTAKEAADALGYMSLAGWSTNESINGLMPILRLSEATGADLATTSDLVTDSMSAMGIEVSELNKYLDIAANANNKTNQTATQLMETYIGAGGMFKTLNTSMAEAAAISGVLANRGIKGSEAGTALNAILVNLMGNGRSSGAAFNQLGVSAYTAEGKFRGITTVLKDVAKALDGASEQKIGKIETLLGGKTQMATLQALLSGITTLNSEGISELEELTAEFEKSDGALQKMADAMRDTFSGALDILGSASDDVKIQIMKEIEPTLTPIIRKIADALPGLCSKVASFVKSAVRNIKSLYKEVSPFIQNLDFNKIKVGIMGLAGAFAAAKIASKVKSISSAFKGLFSVVKANPLGLFIEVVAALGTAFYEVHRQALKANLEKHFGDISLSIEQINDIADTIVDKKPFQKLFKALDISRELKEQEKALQEYINNIEHLNIKIDAGCTLTIDEQQQYKESVLNYIEGINQYINDEWQRRNCLFSGDALMQDIINADMTSAWAQASLVGQELSDYINQGINEKGFNIDKEKVMSMMSQLEEIKQQIAIETPERTL